MLRFDLNSFAVSQKAGPHSRPAWVEYLSLRDVCAGFHKTYSKTQSSYCSICSMQGVVSKTGGTEAGTLPKYRNDI